MVMMMIRNEHDMLQMAANLASVCQAPLVLYLSGPLGAGKTTFTRGFLAGLGHQGKVKSPTYTLVESYQYQDIQINHFDFYRIHDPEELELMGIRDYFTDKTIGIIEWPEQGQGYIPKPDIQCTIHPVGELRQINFASYSPQGDQILAALEDHKNDME
jgi:tRNA threonylcarbamoyladenosine biosynthesis protein TsaE